MWWAHMKSRDTLITWLWKVTWQTKITIPPTKVWWMVTSLRGFYLQGHMTLWSCGLARSCDKLKPLCLHYHIAFGHQTWQDGDLFWAAFTHQPFGQRVLQDQMTNQSHSISTDLGHLVLQDQKLKLLNLH